MPTDTEWAPQVARELTYWFERIEREAKTWSGLIAPKPGDADTENAEAMAELLGRMMAEAHRGGHMAWLRRNS